MGLSHTKVEARLSLEDFLGRCKPYVMEYHEALTAVLSDLEGRNLAADSSGIQAGTAMGGGTKFGNMAKVTIQAVPSHQIEILRSLSAEQGYSFENGFLDYFMDKEVSPLKMANVLEANQYLSVSGFWGICILQRETIRKSTKKKQIVESDDEE